MNTHYENIHIYVTSPIHAQLHHADVTNSSWHNTIWIYHMNMYTYTYEHVHIHMTHSFSYVYVHVHMCMCTCLYGIFVLCTYMFIYIQYEYAIWQCTHTHEYTLWTYTFEFDDTRSRTHTIRMSYHWENATYEWGMSNMWNWMSHVTHNAHFELQHTNPHGQHWGRNPHLWMSYITRMKAHSNESCHMYRSTYERVMPHGEVGGWGRDPFSRNFMKPTPRRK